MKEYSVPGLATTHNADVLIEPTTGPATSPATSEGAAKKRKKSAQQDDEDDEDDSPTSLHPDDPANFLKLCKALRILFNRTLTKQDIDQADVLLRSYCSELVSVCIYKLRVPLNHNSNVPYLLVIRRRRDSTKPSLRYPHT